MIAQLKAENFELKQKERDYNLLNSQLMDLEHRFKLLQEEKDRLEKDGRVQEELQLSKADNMQLDLKSLKETIDVKSRQVADMEGDLIALKKALEDKSGEIAKLRGDLEDFQEQNVKILKEKRDMESDMGLVEEERRRTQDDVNRVALNNEKLSKTQSENSQRVKDNQLEIARLSRLLDGSDAELRILDKQLSEKSNEIAAVREARQADQKESDNLMVDNSRLQSHKHDLELRVKDLELLAARAREKYDDSLTLLGAKEKELKEVRTSTLYADDKAKDSRLLLQKLQGENENLRALMDKYKDDTTVLKKLKEEETIEKLRIEHEKKKIEREALEKEMEARSAKKELEKVQETHDRLLEDKYQIHEELQAVKEHAELLQSQNAKVVISFFIFYSYIMKWIDSLKRMRR